MKGLESFPVRYMALILIAALLLFAMLQATSTISDAAGAMACSINNTLGRLTLGS